MQSGQLLNLQRLERQYLQTLSQNGWESPVVVNAAVDFANTLIRDGRSLLKSGNNPQAEMFFNRAKEITTPISITSGIFYTANFVLARGNAILQIVQLYEQQNQYQKAWMNIKEVVPFMEKFAYTKRVNISEDDQNVLKLYVQLLFHGCEVCRMMHRKDDMLDQCNKYVEILQRLGITFDSLRNLTKDEFHQEFKKWFLMLAKAFYYIGKSQFKVGFEKEALRNLYKSWQISELIYGMDAPATIKARDKYEKLSQKMEFEMIMGKEKVDFQQFKEDLQKDVGQELLKKVVTLKPNKNFNHHIIQQVKSYQQIVGQLTQHTTKYQMPEYVKKVRIEYEDKLRTISFQQKFDDSNNKQKQYQIKNKKSSSRAVSTYNQSLLPQDRLFSPRLSNATQSQRSSLYQLENHMDQLKQQLQTTELKKDTVDDLLLSRPQIKSEYVVQRKKKNDNKETESAQQIKNISKKKFLSNRLIPRVLNKQSSQLIHIKSDSQQSEQKIHKLQTIQDLNQQQQMDDLHVPTTESILAQQQQQQIQQMPVIQNVLTEVSEKNDNHFADLLNKYTMDQLNLAATIIQSCYRRYSKGIKKVQSIQTIELTPINLPRPINATQISEKIDSQQTGRNQMKVSIKEMKNSVRRRNFGFDSIVKEIKNTDSDQSSSNKAKTVIWSQLLKSSTINQNRNCTSYLSCSLILKLRFGNSPIFGSEPLVMPTLKIRIRRKKKKYNMTYLLVKYVYICSKLQLENQLQYIMNIFADVQSIKALQLIVYFRLSNDKQQYTLNFKINNFASYLDEYQRWFSKDRLQNFNGLLSIYCKQQTLHQSNKYHAIIFSGAEYAHEIVSKLLYALKNHYYLIRSVVGFKIISMKDVIQHQLQHDIIDIRSYYKNKQIEKENKRRMIQRQFKIEPIKIIEHKTEELPTISSSSRNRKQQLFSDEIKQSREQSIIIQDSDDNKSDLSKGGVTSQSPTEQKQFSNNFKSIENISEKDFIQEIPQRNPKKQYSVIHNRNTMASPRFDSIISSQALIRNAVQRKTHVSHFLEFSKKQKPDEIKKEEFNFEPPISKQSLDEYSRDRSQSDIQFLNDYLPEFQFANLADFAEYQPQEGPIISFKNQFNYKSTYFPPRGQIIQPEPEQFLPEYPDQFIMLNVTLRQDNSIKTGYILYEDGSTYLVIDNQDGNIIKQLIQIDPGIRLPNRQKKLQILELLKEKKSSSQRLTLAQELKQYNYRHTEIILDRYIKRVNHYDEFIHNEIHQYLRTNQVMPPTEIKCLNYSEKRTSLILMPDLNRTETEEGIQLTIETGVNQSNEEAIDSKSFLTYRSKFHINNNKFYYFEENLNFKVETCFREVKILDTKLLYLSDQQAKQDLLVLKKNMHELIRNQKLLVKITLYNPNQHLYYFRTIQSIQDIEKMLHIFIKPQLIGYQIKSQAKLQRKLIGRALQFNRQFVSLEDRNRDKFSGLDQFLLMYIIDPLQFINNENHRLLKQTILFYYFKQQLKLTLISSSRLRYFMKTYFHRKTFNAQSRVSNIGKVFVECEVYQFNEFYCDQLTNDHTYFYFQITPQESRTKVFKLVLDFADIKSICNKVTSHNCFQDKVLREIIKILTAYLVCYRTNTYHGIKIPLSYIASQSKYDLHNTFTEVTYGSNILEEQQHARSSHPKLSILISDPMLRKKSQVQIMDVQIDNLQMPEEANKVLKNTTMLTPIFRGQKFIYKTTKIVNNMYVIITISYLSLNKFQIGLYIPQTCRNFSCYISSNDFQNMNPVFLESIFPSCLVTKETIDQFYINRWKFSEMNKIYQMAINHPDEFEDFYSEMRSQARAIPQSELQKLTESKVSINNEDEFLDKPLDDTPKMLDSFSDQSRQNARSSTQPPLFVKKQFSKQFSVQNSIGQTSMRLPLPTSQFQQKTDKSIFYRNSPRVSNQDSIENLYSSDKDLFFNQILVRKNNLDMISTFEIKIWESLIDRVKITKNQQNRFILNLDTFKGVLRENLYTQVVYLGNEVNALFEVFVENIRKPFNMLKPYIPIRLNESQNFQLYQRITLFEQPKIVNFKLMLRKVLYSYYNDERRNLQNLKLNDCSVDQYEFIESDIQKCSVYMLNKLKKQLKLNPSKFIVQDVQGDEKCPQVIKVNANYEQYSSFKSYQYTLLKRMVFTMRPTQIYEKRKRFWLYFESMKNCKNTTVKYNLKEIQHCIPNAIGLLNLGLHQELGNRIYRSFKNRLLVSTHQLLQ
ncbi:unnamed protein product (macronuclear) [Paramecium tetraurelia]|uniref:Uncharacterized protein n=1 Tax=Paramecium tetraurelia TaxID=5888 RepID=A0BJN9_PARTE|nr:uncharacterized protein GSPATT00029384001 [Paramecium tetraurelia]CAK58756.1 unnamed protein product [Paramecium tetraurelia]|eukprot:XP_001426154.1 hypothetical protein (macronuclear) [Paramecium tetraurelia strain d4-2]